jgi:GWxTD domain-containing protein
MKKLKKKQGLILWAIALTLALAVGLLLSGCTYARLEAKLTPELKDWYRLHSILMEEKIPWYINIVAYDEENKPIYSTKNRPSEGKYFLKLSPELQKRYRLMFWEIRQEGAREVFYSRVEYVNDAFRREGKKGWMTDRGQILLLVGPPDFIQWFRNYEITLPTVSELTGDYMQVWYYHRPYPASYYFRWQPPDVWRLDYGIGLANASDRNSLERYWRELLAPTENGWDTWAGVIKTGS